MPCKTFLLFAENDNLLSANKKKIEPGIITRQVSGSDHFFIGREQEVSRLVESFLLAEPVVELF